MGTKRSLSGVNKSTMLEKPALDERKIIAALRAEYGLPITGVEFLPIGNDATAWVYRVQTGSEADYFLKVKKGEVYEPAVAVPRYLKDHGIEQVVAPLRTGSGALWTTLDNFTLVLSPYIVGGPGMEVGMSDGQRIEFGAILKCIHTIGVDPALANLLRRESFVSRWIDVAMALDARIEAGDYGDSFERDLARFWKEKRVQIRYIVARTQELGRLAQRNPGEFVLCHADIHTYNVLIDGAGKLHIVDWDETLLAPKERDLMFVAGGIGGAEEAEREKTLFHRGYGDAEVDPVAFAYYRYEWVVQDMGDYAERIFLTEDTGEETRQDAVDGFRQLFAPGDVVEIAYQTEQTLPLALRKPTAQ
jgi:spectinomycin phosphotransferase